jgi:signal peptidase I
MSREVHLHGGINSFSGDVDILEVHGGVANINGRVGAVNQFGGVLNGKVFRQQEPPQPKVKIQYRDRVVYRDKVVYQDRIVYRNKIVYRDVGELTDQMWLDKITRLENEHEAKVKTLQAEVAELKERLQGALDAYHGLLHPTKEDAKPYRTWDDYRPTRAECEAVLKNMKVWLECEQELEPINLY